MPGAAGDEDLLRRKPDAPLPVVGRDGLPQEGRAAFGHIAMEAVLPSLVLYGFMQGGNHRGGERKGKQREYNPLP